MSELIVEPRPEQPGAPSSRAAKPVNPADLLPQKLARARPLFDPAILKRAVTDSFIKLNPITLLKNPVIFVVETGAAVTTVFLVRDIAMGAAEIGFPLQIALWLW